MLYSRAGCALCEEMLAEFDRIRAARDYPIEVRDVDADPATRVLYGHKIPVLLLGGDLVCHGRLDEQELLKALTYHRRPV